MRKNYLQYLASLLLQKPFRQHRGFFRKTMREEPGTTGDTRTANGHPASLFAAEKRKHPRSPVGRTVTFSMLRGDGTDEESGLQAYAVDISVGGIGILTDRPLEHGRAFRFDDETVQGIGVVRWRIKFIQRNIYRIGIQFNAAGRSPSR